MTPSRSAPAGSRSSLRPPRLVLLQLFNVLVGAASLLAFTAAASAWTADGWDPRHVGCAGMAANLCYAGLVAQGGTLSDRWGRARTAVLGAALAAIGTALALAGGSAGWACAGVMLAFAGTAFFFPGNVGLFSDARGDGPAADPPLHLKVSRYNISWSTGNLVGFGVAWLLAATGLPAWTGFVLAVAAYATVAASLWRWRSLPPGPPTAAGDRIGHPALGRMTLMARTALGIYCCMGMAFVGLIENSLAQDGLAPERAHSLAVASLTACALGHVFMFWLLGRWDGWILRPWRALALQGGIVAAAFLVLAVGMLHWYDTPVLLLCGLVLGLGYGAVYTPSIYYSLRLPTGAARAASLHETALGIGATLGPVLAGLFIARFLAGHPGAGVAALGCWMTMVSLVVVAWQIALIPGARRLGAG